ncbi:uncharacterized protein LOC18434369 [Amborella trichopoda]|uniref:Poly A polymerase head domain-containing protein n=1 Tax=Amborella trichopoda TaxID=13333 RepID=W1PE08_AMBTC|nr:uncharacterized protein LOC18434369 [Amborella trichopoda]ERN06178.1 hypothetical protein AMTR_s00016p00133200 [Amborella trichopoda]|eukprot:XP_006844503.1 uncharacterized protein LOC18434369 [Amborella trichopoda]
MAITGWGITYKNISPFRPPLFCCVRKVRYSVLTERIADNEASIKEECQDANGKADWGGPNWKKLSSKELGITTSMISEPTRVVLNGLRKRGYEVYLVGGCVRDLILKRTPKDFDIITSADLKEVMRTFSRCQIVGRRFPICHVHVDDYIVEVSSFNTSERNLSRDLRYIIRKPPGQNDRDYARWKNCMHRDFTINGLMFDPYAKLIYDYMGSMEDIRKAKVRTVIPAHNSFQEDCARILRAVRIAARLGFRFTKETAHSVKDFSSSILRLDKSRLLMEMNYMLAFGSAEASLRVLWKFGLLEILLPLQAAYFVSQGFLRRDKRSNMLLTLFSNLDKLLAPNRPCHSSLWVGILAFHLALVDEPQDPLVVATFTLAVHNGGHLAEAISLARHIDQPHNSIFPELLEPKKFDTDTALIDEVLDLASLVKAALSMMTDEYIVSQAMAKYPQAPFSDLVFIPLQVYLKVSKLFECVQGGKEKGFVPKRGKTLNYESLAQGGLREVRHTFARIVFDTVYPNIG